MKEKFAMKPRFLIYVVTVWGSKMLRTLSG